MGIELKPHNLKAYGRVKEVFETNDRVAVVHPTGTGKSYIALKLIEENPDKKVLYLSPSLPIMLQLKRNMSKNDIKSRNVEMMTYQKLLSLADNDSINSDYDFIILDEFHHLGAPRWGSAVDKLLENNKSANVLGLSATPIRYLDDEVRDMAKEIFDDNIASEMTLEEAMATGVLKEPTYITGIYEVSGMLSELEEKIEECTDPSKKQVAEKELQQMRSKLEALVAGLPELLESAMTNKSGKYIVYCKNIEDMQERMKEAQNLFGKVNPNMEIMSVSSSNEDIWNNERTIKEFEEADKTEKLHLLFSVNMLNEGYHLKDLDGVIMMRPTSSPNLYCQQLGRALSVGNEISKPIVVDLVNNIDAIRIIEGFRRSLSEESTRCQNKYVPNFSISEDIREIREYVARIDELVSRRKMLTNEEKFELMTEYMDLTGKKITDGTMYKGYNLGKMQSNLRQQYWAGSLKMEDELLKKFLETGIIVKKKGREGNTENFDQKNYKFVMNKFNWLYDREAYELVLSKLQTRYNNGKLTLTVEEIQKLKDEGLLNLSPSEKRGVREKYKELISYGFSESKIAGIQRIYGSFENYLYKVKTQEISSNRNCVVTLSSKEMIQSEKMNYLELIREICGVYFKSGEHGYRTGEYIDIDVLRMALSQLTPREQVIIRRRYGIECEKYTAKQVSEIFGCSGSRIGQKGNAIIAKLRGDIGNKLIKENKEKILKELKELKEKYEEVVKSKFRVAELQKEIGEIHQIREFMYANNVEGKSTLNFELLEKEGITREKVLEFGEFTKISGELKREIEIEELDLSTRPYNCLIKAGINTIGDIIEQNPKELFEIRNLGKKSGEEILEKMKELGFEWAGGEWTITENQETEQIDYGKFDERCVERITEIKKEIDVANGKIPQADIRIEELDLSVRPYNCLKRARINTIGEIVKRDLSELLKFRNMGEKSFEEIIKKMKRFGFDVSNDGVWIYNNMIISEEGNNPYEIMKRIEELETQYTEARVAYDTYLEYENVFDPNSVVPSVDRGFEPVELVDMEVLERDVFGKGEQNGKDDDGKAKGEVLEGAIDVDIDDDSDERQRQQLADRIRGKSIVFNSQLEEILELSERLKVDRENGKVGTNIGGENHE